MGRASPSKIQANWLVQTPYTGFLFHCYSRAIFAMRLSYRLVGIVQATLRPEEIHAAATEFYRAIVDDARDYEHKQGRRHNPGR